VADKHFILILISIVLVLPTVLSSLCKSKSVFADDNQNREDIKAVYQEIREAHSKLNIEGVKKKYYASRYRISLRSVLLNAVELSNLIGAKINIENFSFSMENPTKVKISREEFIRYKSKIKDISQSAVEDIINIIKINLGACNQIAKYELVKDDIKDEMRNFVQNNSHYKKYQSAKLEIKNDYPDIHSAIEIEISRWIKNDG